MNANLPRPIILPLAATLSVILLVLAGCSTPAVQPTVIPATATLPAPIQASDTPIPASTLTPVQTKAAPTARTTPQPFPLSGTWSGMTVNNSLRFQVTLTLNPDCATGSSCGTFDIPIVPCSGTYVLVGEQNGQYEFGIENKSATCGEGRDFLRLLPDGTLQFVSRGNYGESLGILSRVDPLAAKPGPLPVIFDDDGSPDGTTALLYLLSDPAVSVQAVTISHGEAHPKVYIQHMGRMLEDFGILGMPLGTGQDKALIPGEDFPEWLHQISDSFWGFPVPNAAKTYSTQDAAQLMVSMLNRAPAPVAIFVSGPCTDLALALRLDPGIRKHISAIYIMGGAVYVPGNLTDFSTNPKNVSAEWNIYIDPLAASEVFESGVPVILVPLDATNQVSAMMADTSQWRAGGKRADFAADMYDMLLGGSNTKQMSLWDVMTAEIMVHPKLCDTLPLHLKVITDQGNTYGQTLVLTDGKPNVQVCLKPDVAAIKKTLMDVFAASR